MLPRIVADPSLAILVLRGRKSSRIKLMHDSFHEVEQNIASERTCTSVQSSWIASTLCVNFDTVIVNSSDISTDHLVGIVQNFEVVLGSNIQDEITNRTPVLLLQLLDGKRLLYSHH